MAFVFVLSLLLILYLHLILARKLIHEGAWLELIAFIEPMIGQTGRIAYFISIQTQSITAKL